MNPHDNDSQDSLASERAQAFEEAAKFCADLAIKFDGGMEAGTRTALEGCSKAFARRRDAALATPVSALATPAAAAEPARCEYCDGTGDVHGRDGEWRGVCTCPAGVALATPAAAAEPSDIADRVVQLVCEMDDRTSPEDWPEAMLVTGPELHAFVLLAFEREAEKSIATPPEAAASVQGEVMKHRLMHKVGDNWISASEFLTGMPDKTWVAKAQELPGEWRIEYERRWTGSQIANGIAAALNTPPSPAVAFAELMKDLDHICAYGDKGTQETAHDARDRLHAILATPVVQGEPVAAAEPSLVVQGERFGMAALIERDCCESEAADPDSPNTICINIADLRTILGNRLATPAAAAEPERCEYCDGTGDVHGRDGEWRGVCTCPAGVARATPAAAAEPVVQGEASERERIIVSHCQEIVMGAFKPAKIAAATQEALGRYFALRTADRASLETHPGTEEA